MLVVGEHAGKHIADFSGQFQGEFVALLSRRFGTKRVRANQVYQEYISDKHHLHMNSTRWVTLTEFVKYLGRSGIARVDETDKGWFIAWIDNSPKALAKAEASLKKERATTSDEQRERQLIAEQIERAATEAEPASSSTTPPAEEGLKRDENAEKLVLSFSAKPLPSLSLPAGGLKLNPLKPPKANPLKRPNVLKTPPGEKPNEKNRAAPVATAERLTVDDQERKRRRMDRESVA
jgi:DNA/RNA-binding protein KIN17